MSYIVEILTTLFFTVSLCLASSYYSVNRLIDMFITVEEVNGQLQATENNNEPLEGFNVVTENSFFQLFLQVLEICKAFLNNVARILFLFFNVGTILVI